jgi:amino acid adenylation domain-containing protein
MRDICEAAGATRSVASAVAHRVATAPDAVAITTASATITYRALDERAAALAGALRAQGVAAGDVVGVCLPRSIDQIVALLAAWYAGAAYLPLDPAWPAARRASFVARAGCAAVITTADHGEIAGTAVWIAPNATAAPVRVEAPADLAYLIYTSGSTGDPKAVEIGHDNLAALIDWHRTAFAIAPGTRTSHLAGLGFDAAAWEVWPTLAAGGTLYLADDSVRHDALALRDWLIAERVVVAFAPTALAEPLMTMRWPADASLRVLLTGADKLTVRPAAGQPFVVVNNYGPTECTVVATSGIVPPDGDGLPTIGRAIAGTIIHLLDPLGAAVAAGRPGEIHIGGAQVGRGYRGDPALTAARFIDHPEFGRLYRTGDLAFERDDGELVFLGRADGQVKVRGHRVEPAEIAAALNRLAEVAQSVVVLRDSQLVAYIVPAAPGLVAAALRDALAGDLPDYMIPARFAALDALPLTANGKIDLRALPDPDHCTLAEATTRAPQGPTEARLFAIISEVIGRSDFGVEDDFFLIGGHSLLGTQVVVRAREAFGVELTLFHLFEARSVAALAVVIESLVMAMLDGLSDDDIARLSAA